MLLTKFFPCKPLLSNMGRIRASPELRGHGKNYTIVKSNQSYQV
jgi:hypothetical protein